jgi:hypothetical protein
MPLIVEITNRNDPTSISAYGRGQVCLNSVIIPQRDISVIDTINILPWINSLESGAQSNYSFPTREANDLGAPYTHQVTKSYFVR